MRPLVMYGILKMSLNCEEYRVYLKSLVLATVFLLFDMLIQVMFGVDHDFYFGMIFFIMLSLLTIPKALLVKFVFLLDWRETMIYFLISYIAEFIFSRTIYPIVDNIVISILM